MDTNTRSMSMDIMGTNTRSMSIMDTNMGNMGATTTIMQMKFLQAGELKRRTNFRKQRLKRH